MRYRDVSVEEALKLKDVIFVDVRSPHEYKDFHIPGALNIPLFEDEEKRLIGTIYRNEGIEKAKRLGYRIAEGKVKQFYREFLNLKEKYENVVVYCWRGGMRSRGMCQAMADMGLELLRLEGGYRAYRQFILRDMERILESVEFIVLTGKTGVGKTKLLHILKEKDLPVIDIEALAKDRGSVFGSVGIEEKVSQKMFDSLLYEELKRYEGRVIFIEDESRWIGNVHLPDAFWFKKLKGYTVEITSGIESRVRLIVKEYTQREGWQRECLEALHKIKKYLGDERFNRAVELMNSGRYEELVRFLIEEYYDKKYKLQGNAEIVIEADDREGAVRKLENIHRVLERKFREAI